MKRDRERNGITAGLLLIGLGILIYTNEWWPYIMYVLGISISAGLAYRGKFADAAVMLAVFLGIPFMTETGKVPWNLAAPAVLVTLGVLVLLRELTRPKEEKQKK